MRNNDCFEASPLRNGRGINKLGNFLSSIIKKPCTIIVKTKIKTGNGKEK